MKACPFCAYPTPEVVRRVDDDRIVYEVNCPNCGARGPAKRRCRVKSMTLDDILAYLADLEPQQEESWINEMIRQQQRRLRKRLKARYEREIAEGRAPEPYGPQHYGPMGAKREG